MDTKARILFYTWVNNTPYDTDQTRRLDIPFSLYVVYDENYRILKAVHNSRRPIKKEVVQEVKSDRPGFFSKTLDRAHSNIGLVN